jgi:hypothetical protein
MKPDSTPQPSQWAILWRALAIVLIALFVLMGYAWGHKPLNIDGGLDVAVRVIGAALDLATMSVIAVIAGGVGRSLVSRVVPARVIAGTLSRAERIALDGGIGLAALSLLLLIIGMIGAFQPIIVWGVAFAAAAICFRGVRAWIADGRGVLATGFRAESGHITANDAASDAARATKPDTGAGWLRFCIVFVIGMLSLALVEALAPPHRWDSLAYQLIAPTRLLDSGRLQPYADNFYLGFPQSVNIIFAWAMSAFGRETAAAPIHFLYGVFGLIAAMGVARRAAGRVAGWTVGLLLMSAYSLWALFGWAYTDLAALLYGALALSIAAAWRESHRWALQRNVPTAPFAGWRWLIVLGMIVGAAVGVKYTAGALALAAGVIVLVYAARPHALGNPAARPLAMSWRGGWGVRFLYLSILATSAALTYAPWAVRGIVHYGNPIYPFAFGGLNWDAFRAELFSFSERGLLATGQAWQAAILPFSATIFGADRTDGFGFTAGAWLLTTFALLPFVWRWLPVRERRAASTTLLFLAPLIAVWTVTALGSSVGMQTRLMTMTLPAFAVAGAIALRGLAAFPTKPLDVRFIGRTLIIASIGLYAIDGVRVWAGEGAAAVVLSITAPDEYLYNNTGAHYPAMTALAQLPAGSQVRFMWEPRAYYCPAEIVCRADVLFDHWLYPRYQGVAPDAVLAGYRADGDDYLLVWRAGYDEYNDVFARYADLTASFYPALERQMREVWTDGVRYTVYGWQDAE